MIQRPDLNQLSADRLRALATDLMASLESREHALIHHEPDNTQCQCGCQLKRIGEGVSEKLDYVPGEFAVKRHIRGK